MRLNTLNRTIGSLVISAIVTVTGFAQEATSAMTQPVGTEQTSTASTVSTPAAAAIPAEAKYNTAEVREEFLSILYRHPHELAMVLKYDPSLLRNEAYLANYPEVADYLKKHPEIAQNSTAFLNAEWISQPEAERITPAERSANEFLESITIMLSFAGVTLALIWLIRTLLAHRRWSRAWKVQMDLHNKLLDRLTSHEELLRYVETGGGKQLFESVNAPMTATPEAAPPLSRIVWSVQGGIVLAVIGVGMLLLSLRSPEGTGDGIFGLGIISLSAGIGLIVSGAVGYVLSQRLGLMKPAARTNE